MIAEVDDIADEYKDTVLERLIKEGRHQKKRVGKHIKPMGLELPVKNKMVEVKSLPSDMVFDIPYVHEGHQVME